VSELYLFKVDEDGEHHSVIAHDEGDALQIIIEFGCVEEISTPEQFRAEKDIKFTRRADDFQLTITYEDLADIEPALREQAEYDPNTGYTRVRLGAGEWISKHGRGYLGGSCW